MQNFEFRLALNKSNVKQRQMTITCRPIINIIITDSYYYPFSHNFTDIQNRCNPFRSIENGVLVDKLRPIFDPVILSSGICSPYKSYKSRSSIGLKSLKIRTIVVILGKHWPGHSDSWCQQVCSEYQFLHWQRHTERDTYTHTHMDFALMLIVIFLIIVA